MEKEVGGGIGMGNTCKPMAVSFQCMTKSTTIKKIIIIINHIHEQYLEILFFTENYNVYKSALFIVSIAHKVLINQANLSI